MSRVLGVLLLILLSVSAQAEICEETPSSLQTLLEESWTEEYRSLQCSDNVWRLREKMLNLNWSMEEAYSAIFRKLHPLHDPLRPRQARDDEQDSRKWSFHHVVLYQGWVVDLDFGDSAQIVSWAEYIQTMWPENEKILVQVQPLIDLGPNDLYGAFSESKYPLHLLTEAVEYRPSSSTCVGFSRTSSAF